MDAQTPHGRLRPSRRKYRPIPPSCPLGCHHSEQYQPDKQQPGRIVAVCTWCGRWRIYADDVLIVQLFTPKQLQELTTAVCS
jgi:hypothetical protein